MGVSKRFKNRERGTLGEYTPFLLIDPVKEISPLLHGERGEPGNRLAVKGMDNMDIRELCHMNPTAFSGGNVNN